MMSHKGQVTIWRGNDDKVFASRKKAFRLQNEAVPEKQTPNDLAWSPDGRKVLAVSESGYLLYADLPVSFF